MNSEYIEEVIRNFVKKEKQDRLIWELNNPKKRESVIWHFSGPKIFKDTCLRPISYMDANEMTSFLFNLGNSRNVYFFGESYIGELSLSQAAAKASTGEICIIYLGSGVGYYQGEQEYGKPPRFMLFCTNKIT